SLTASTFEFSTFESTSRSLELPFFEQWQVGKVQHSHFGYVAQPRRSRGDVYHEGQRPNLQPTRRLRDDDCTGWKEQARHKNGRRPAVSLGPPSGRGWLELDVYTR